MCDYIDGLKIFLEPYDMNKKERGKEIREMLKIISVKARDLKFARRRLELELSYIRGHYTQSWENKYDKTTS